MAMAENGKLKGAENGKLKGQVALVVGASGYLGSHVAHALESWGMEVAWHYHKKPPRFPRAEKNVQRLLLQADMSSALEAERLVERVLERHERLDLAVHAAGDFLWKPLLETSPEEWERVMATNLTSAFYLARACWETMSAQSRGHLVFLGQAGCLDFKVKPSMSVVHIAKQGLWLLMRSLAREGAPKGIRVNLLSPGIMEKTEIESPAPLPMKRKARPEDITGALAYLLGEESSYLTGNQLEIAGGWGL